MADTLIAETDPEVRGAMAEWYRQQAAKEKALARKELAMARASEISLERSKRNKAFEDADDMEYGIFRFSGIIEHDSVVVCREHLNRWARMKPGSDLSLVVNSPGGYIFDGMELYDEIIALRDRGHQVTITVRGQAASMAGIILQAASPGQRFMGSESYLLIHEPLAGAIGSLGALEDITEWLQSMNARVLDIYAKRCKESNAVKPFTRAELVRRQKRKDWSIPSDQAVNGGLADGIA